LHAAYKLSRLLIAENTELVLTKGMMSHLYGGLAARRAGIPCVWHVQDHLSERYGGVYRLAFGRLAAWLPERVIADGSSIAQQLSAARSRVTVVLNGIDTSIFRPRRAAASVRSQLGVPSDALVIGHVARITRWKGQHHLLRAFARLAPNRPQVHLLFVGAPLFDNDDYERELKRMTLELGLENRVTFAGYRSDLSEVLASMDLFAYTSTEKDTSPLALLSAMAVGLPIVAFDIPGVREILQPIDEVELGPFLVQVGKPEKLADALEQLLASAETRRAAGERSRKKAVENFRLEAHVARIEAVLKAALRNSRHAQR
jgi:glycosyltransferase involved in cell wall biosynthesis